MPKKIAVFTRSTIDHFKSGGMETQLKNLIEGLVKLGYKITVITTSLPDGTQNTYNHETIEKQIGNTQYIFIGGTTPGLRPLTSWEKIFNWAGLLKRSKYPEGDMNYFLESIKYFKKDKYDLIISQSTSAQGVINSEEYLKNHIPSISIIHGTIKAEIKNRFKANKTFLNWARFLGVDLINWIIELLTSNKMFFNRIDKIIAVSENLKSQFIEENIVNKEKVSVIYNGVDENIFRPSDRKNNDFSLLYVGRMDREKGIDVIIKSMKILRDKNLKIKLNLVGSGVYLNELKLIADSLEVSENINFEGPVDNAKVPEYYKNASLFVFPTNREEGHPMTVSEAFCSGLPVLATKMGGLKDVIFDGENGYFIKNNDAKDLALKVENLYKDDNLLRKLSDSAYKAGVSKYSQKAMSEKYDSLIRSII